MADPESDTSDTLFVVVIVVVEKVFDEMRSVLEYSDGFVVGDVEEIEAFVDVGRLVLDFDFEAF